MWNHAELDLLKYRTMLKTNTIFYTHCKNSCFKNPFITCSGLGPLSGTSYFMHVYTRATPKHLLSLASSTALYNTSYHAVFFTVESS
jgi:hypothetical protein